MLFNKKCILFFLLNIPPKYLIFLWRLVKKAIPSPNIVKEHHVQGISRCPFCQMDEVRMDHIFMHCEFVRSVWFGIGVVLEIDERDGVEWIIGCSSKEAINLMAENGVSHCSIERMIRDIRIYVWGEKNVKSLFHLSFTQLSYCNMFYELLPPPHRSVYPCNSSVFFN